MIRDVSALHGIKYRDNISIIEGYLKRLSMMNKSLCISRTKEDDIILLNYPQFSRFETRTFTENEVFSFCKISISRSRYLFFYKFDVIMPLIFDFLKRKNLCISKRESDMTVSDCLEKKNFLEFHRQLKVFS